MHLRRDFAGVAGANHAALLIAGKSLVEVHKWTFLLGPAFCAGIGNGILLGYLMYRSASYMVGHALDRGSEVVACAASRAWPSGVAQHHALTTRGRRWLLLGSPETRSSTLGPQEQARCRL